MTLHAEAIERKQKAPPLTVDGLLRRRASQRPGVTALCDPPNLAALGFGEPKTLSYRETDAAVDALASFFIELGLEPGDTVVAQLPNLAMAPLTLLGAWRAGLTVAAVPMLWRAEEIAKVCEEVAPKALIGVSSFVGEKRAETLCAMAASQLSVRFVLGFGRDLPDGVASLDEAIAAGQTGRERLMDSPPRLSPAMITFTARAGAPLVAVARREEELLAQGAMTVLSLSLDAGDVILNPYPLTGPVGLSLGLMAWLVSGGTLVQHTPFDYQPFVKQLLDSGATVTAMPPPSWPSWSRTACCASPPAGCGGSARCGRCPSSPHPRRRPSTARRRCCSMSIRSAISRAWCCAARRAQASPRCRSAASISRTTRRPCSSRRSSAGYARARPTSCCCADRWCRAARGCWPCDAEGFVSTGLRAEAEPGDSGRLRIRRDAELLHHGGFAVAASELDQLYQSFPGYLDAACFVLSDPIIGERIFAAIVPKPSEPIALEALHRFLVERQVAPYKFPDRLLVVKQIPRDADGRVLREQILQQV